MTGQQIIEFIWQHEANKAKDHSSQTQCCHSEANHLWEITTPEYTIRIEPCSSIRPSLRRFVETHDFGISEEELTTALIFMPSDYLLEELTKNVYVLHQS
jgi:hypothetical protein